MPDAAQRSGLILGIETSCDETAAAVVRSGSETLSNVVASQIALHANFGGVVPELASREHLRNIVPVVRAAIAEAGIDLDDLDAIAVTRGPGLAGALLVGITYAKALAFGLGKPLIGVNHLEGHIHAVFMDQAAHLAVKTGAAFFSEATLTERVGSSGAVFEDFESAAPLLALVVSGGHTHLYLAQQQPGAPGSEPIWHYRNVGRTVDDAAGEAFDKVAKLLGLGYPGGPWIDGVAPRGNPRAVPFHFSPIKPRNPDLSPDCPPDPRFDLSFSGIKTAVLRYTQNHGMQATIEHRRALTRTLAPTQENLARLIADRVLEPQTLDLLASFQNAVVGILLKQTFAAARHSGARSLLISGGVAANSELRRRFTAEADRCQLRIAFPSIALSTDNAAMIAAAAWPRFRARDFDGEDLTATPQLRLG